VEEVEPSLLSGVLPGELGELAGFLADLVKG